MRRRTLDALLSIGGAIVAAILLVAAGLLLWAGNFANNTVSQQLADQRITMPSGAAMPTRRSSRTSSSTPASR